MRAALLQAPSKCGFGQYLGPHMSNAQRQRAETLVPWEVIKECVLVIYHLRVPPRVRKLHVSVPEISGKEYIMCGKDFTPSRSDARICSNACRQKAHRRRVRDNAPSV